MKAIFKTFISGSGDCIILRLVDGDEQFVFLVDCGVLEQPIENYIINECKKHINLLIVTHIDNDHILGVNDLLKEVDGLKVDEIIYNSYQRNVKAADKKKLPKEQQEYLDRLIHDIPVIRDMLEHNIGAADSFNLANTILSTPKLSKVWNVEPILDSTPEKSLGKWGKIVYLSPSSDQLQKLNEVYLTYFFEKLFAKAEDKKWKKGEAIYEYLIRYAEHYNYEKLNALLIGAEDVTKEYLEAERNEPAKPNSITPQNNASLAFMWENAKSTKRILFLGDANPVQVQRQIEKKYGELPTPVIFNVIKVAHHGSHYNTTNELMSVIDSSHFFFTGGEERKRPSFSCIGKIVCRPIENGNKRHLHFNYITQEVKKIKAAKQAQEELKFDCDTSKNEYEFEV